ncbi:MAG: FAD-dependent oxidoreductase [Dehalococcoidia bacterium]|nr:FAD-dependent oxidoreductase [Dehalococcoidia bacterium]
MTTIATEAPKKKAQIRLVAPCTRDCPAGIDIPRYIGYVLQGRYSEAMAVVRERMPFPSVCAHVCYRPCETGCRRSKLDEPVAINALKRVAADNDVKKVWRRDWKLAPPTGRRVAIVGSGPAGLTAAYYLSKVKGHGVTIFEALPELGGQLRIGIPAYRLPRTLLDEEIDIIVEAGVKVVRNTRLERPTDLLDMGFNAVLIACGTMKPNTMGIPGEDLSEVIDGVRFLADANLGRRTSVGARVAIIGGGNVALDCARVALRLGAQHAVIIYRRTRQEMPAYDFEVEEAVREGVDLMYLASPQKIEQVGGALRLHLQRMQLGEPDASGRRRPVAVPGETFTMDVDNVLAAIGQSADTAPFGLDVNKDGTIKAEKGSVKASMPGVYVAGDVLTGPVSVIEAIAGGRTSAQAIDKYLGGNGDIGETLAPPPGEELLMPATVAPRGEKRTLVIELDPKERIQSFGECALVLTESEAHREALRCIHCDQWRAQGVPSVWPKGVKTD